MTISISDVLLGIIGVATVLPAVGFGLFKIHKKEVLKECIEVEKELSKLSIEDLTEEEKELICNLRAYIKQGRTDDITLKVCEKKPVNEEKEPLLSVEKVE